VSVVALPEDLAPSLRARVDALLAEVELTAAPPVTKPRGKLGKRCWLCHNQGPLVMHHVSSTRTVFIHKSCHRKLHRIQDNLTTRKTRADLQEDRL
jgi:hypothetical protein